MPMIVGYSKDKSFRLVMDTDERGFRLESEQMDGMGDKYWFQIAYASIPKEFKYNNEGDKVGMMCECFMNRINELEARVEA